LKNPDQAGDNKPLRNDDSLRAAAERYRRLLELLPDAVLVTDLQLNIVMANQQAASLFGYTTPQELIGQPAIRFATEEEVDYARQNLEHMFQERIMRQIGYRMRCRDGRIVPVEVSASLIEYDSGQPAEFVVVLRDVSERLRLEQERHLLQQQILQAQKLESLGLLAGGIAHDFNNLLMGVLGNASLALASLQPGSSFYDLMVKIEQAAVRAAELTNQLLAYSGKGRFVVRPVNLSQVVREMSELLRVSMGKNVTLRLDLAAKLPAVMADVAQLRQVVMNLITNAVDAIGEGGGLITLYTGIMEADRRYLDTTVIKENLSEGRYVVLEVSDTGCGMDEQTLSRIFDPFFTTKFTGRGLGLAAVLGIVRGHHGTIKVYSEPGKGTTFKILLPASEEREVAEAVSNAASEKLDLVGMRVLVVDDDQTVREVTRSMLEAAGAEVFTAADGEQALAVFRKDRDRIRFVVLDTTMPGMSAEEVYRRLRQEKPGVRVLLTSGYNEQDVTSRFAGKGLAGFIQKPFQMGQLMSAVRKVIESQPPDEEGQEGAKK
jgi:two-component system cell cycle sensor histidine kinase/response regulator CckA